ncbi:MAG: sulfatase-like hydrolase/transferase, partial [Rhodocyclaceae bacterium]|nr:sulfatase-like hydrolase/transferase [Rhodocyclaceae bacterium]
MNRFFRVDPRRLFAGRFRLAGVVLVAFLALNTATRLGLLAFNEEAALWSPAYLVPILGIGLLFDLAAACWWLPPFALLAALWPDRPHGGRRLRIVATVLVATAFAVLVFVAASEFVFWNEFASRFNFIAVDYLIYTREVIGNIRESYDLRPALAAIAALTAVMTALAWRPLGRAARPAGMGWRGRLGRLAIFLLLPAASFVAVEARFKEFTKQAQAVQLAGNGHWEFWHAFRHNEIDYEQFYRTEPLEKAYRVLRAEFEHIGPIPFTAGARLPIEREVVRQGPERRMNVVLVSVESLSAEFLGAFGNKAGLTPNLDRLAAEGTLFTRLYATGTRTVRGLEALTLSIPPTPGHSIVKRPDNDRLHTLGEIFEERGYESLYLYGGYGYFDNMEAFFGGNGYTVIDRTHIPKEA